jgi:hypothetical protein
MKNALLVRVGADRSKGGGMWNGPVDVRAGQFVYVAIPENRPPMSATIVESPGGFSPPALPDPYVNLSIHTAPDVRPVP